MVSERPPRFQFKKGELENKVDSLSRGLFENEQISDRLKKYIEIAYLRACIVVLYVISERADAKATEAVNQLKKELNIN